MKILLVVPDGVTAEGTGEVIPVLAKFVELLASRCAVCLVARHQIDDIPLDDRRVLDWRHSVGYGPQAAALLQDTIEHNLNWALPAPATELELERALRCAQISHLASDLQEGLGTIVDRREGTLSGGERQRLAIARELLRQPQLLILDEATSALDVDNEALVLDGIRRYYATMTVLVITHRSTAIDRADRVVHIVDGKIQLSRDRVATSC